MMCYSKSTDLLCITYCTTVWIFSFQEIVQLVYTMESMNSIVLADREYFPAFCNHLFTQHLIHHECSCCAKVVP